MRTAGPDNQTTIYLLTAQLGLFFLSSLKLDEIGTALEKNLFCIKELIKWAQ